MTVSFRAERRRRAGARRRRADEESSVMSPVASLATRRSQQNLHRPACGGHPRRFAAPLGMTAALAAADRREATAAVPQRLVARSAADLVRDPNRDSRRTRQARHADGCLRDDRHRASRRIAKVGVVELDGSHGRGRQIRPFVRVQRRTEVEVLPRSDGPLMSHNVLRDSLVDRNRRTVTHSLPTSAVRRGASPPGWVMCAASGVADQMDARHSRCPCGSTRRTRAALPSAPGRRVLATES